MLTLLGRQANIVVVAAADPQDAILPSLHAGLHVALYTIHNWT